MKILVPVKRVPDPYGRISLTNDGELNTVDMKWVINPFDEIALEEAVRIRERGCDVEIVAVSVGGEDSVTILRTALAMGADRAVLVEAADAADPRVVARHLQTVAVEERPDIILMGKQAIDDDNAQVGPRLASRLGVPQAAFASEIVLSQDGRSARVKREVDAGQETIDVTLPAVITTDLRLNEPRYVALPAILKARTKTLDRMASSPAASAPSGGMRIVRQETPPARKPGRIVKNTAELVDALRNEAKVL